jgi:hypothetical protein
LQPDVVHAYLPQLTCVGTGQVVPVPEQNEAGVNRGPLQPAAPHIAVEVWQAPAPSQTLILPQVVVPPPQRVSAAPLVMAAQVP